MDYLPIFVALRGQLCVVVGGGEVAQRKVSLLRAAGARVRVVARELASELAAEVEASGLEYVERAYDSAELDGARLVIAATDDAEVNARVAADARVRGMFVNVVDEPALCSFVMPSIIDRAPVLVAVSTGGASPVLARLTRGALEAALPVRLGALAAFAAKHRARVKAKLDGVPARRGFWERALQGEPGQLVLAGRELEAEHAFEAALEQGMVPRVAVLLIGAGSGDPELLPMAAWRALGGVDLLIHDADVPAEVLSLARRDAALRSIWPAGALTPADLERVVSEARAGGAVCVVRNGDPYATADAEDCQRLRAAGVSFLRMRPALAAEGRD